MNYRKRVLRSFLFVPADKKRMLDNIISLDADAFILDLEDSVSSQNKQEARENISSILPGLKENKKTIFVRTNDAASSEAVKDLEETLSEDLEGYIIPKFEDMEVMERFIRKLAGLEKKRCIKKITSLILMIESPRGAQELRRLALDKKKDIGRFIGIALGGEDYMESLAISRQISKDVLENVRDEIIIFTRSQGILAIDTVYPEYMEEEGLRYELKKIISIGFTSKLAIHPSQINIINESFYPDAEDIKKMKLILSHEKEFGDKGAISIRGKMYDMPHFKWAKKLNDYINGLNKDKG
jgi:citrate lyase subunit beta/citryl-CoA lyase